MSGALKAILDDLDRMSDTLADRMLERYLSSVAGYRALSDETLRQVREVNRHNLRGFIASAREGRSPSQAELDLIRESASRRAREGVPLSALLSAYRTGAQYAWGETRLLIGDRPERLRAGLDLATALMVWTDEASGAAAQAYLAEYERLTSDREAARRDFLDGALTGALTADEILARGEALGLNAAMTYAVALIGLVDVPEDDAPVRDAMHRLKTMAGDLPFADGSLAAARASEFVVVFPATGGNPEVMAERLRSFVPAAAEAAGVRLRAGVGRARESLAELAGSYREASIALVAAGATVPVAVYGEVLVEELILRERSVARRLAHAILEPLQPHPDLRATLIEYMEHGPSLPAVAKRLYLHPNTVAYRLARVKDLTGRDPKTPAGVAELFLALRAAQLVGEDPS